MIARTLAGVILGALLWLALGSPDLPALGDRGQALAGAAAEVLATAVPPPPPVVAGASGGRAELWPGAAPCAGYHDGAIDFCAPEGTPVAAPADGTLADIGSYADTLRYGAYVVLVTAAGLEIYIGHLDHETVNPGGLAVGQWVPAGTIVGYLSEFAYSTPHTHLQLRRGSTLVAPGAWWAEWEGR